VTTVAGNGEQGQSDGPLCSAIFYDPSTICACPHTGDLIIENAGWIRRVTATTVSTVAGCGYRGFKDGPASRAQFNWIRGIAVCPVTGNIVVADAGNNRIRVITPQGMTD